jgi:hypothetical protein
MRVRTRASSVQTWRGALVGGIVSIPLTVGLSWQSGLGSELPLVMAVVAGILAGYLASTGSGDADSAGLRAGLLAVLPGLWFVFEVVLAADTGVSPVWLRAVGGTTVILLFTTALLVFGALAGFLGATVGRWLAGWSGHSPTGIPR